MVQLVRRLHRLYARFMVAYRSPQFSISGVLDDG